MIDIKKWKTEKVENIVKTAVEQMPADATNIRLIEGYRTSYSKWGGHNSWTEVEAVYKNDEGKEVGRIPTIDKIGGWQYSDPANYILYTMGLYKPYSEDNLRKLKQRYEDDLNRKACYPINNIYSNEYLMDLKIKESIFTTSEIGLTFKLDYESNYWKSKNYRIILGDFETEPLSEFDAYFLFRKTFEKLTENGVTVNVDFDMEADDKRKLGHWRWDDIPF